MNSNLQKSIDRAMTLMGTPPDYENYISIKINPSQGGCCCPDHCWPETYAAINKYIAPFGRLKERGDVLIEQDKERYVLECHESGPEIIFYGVISGLLASVIAGLVKVIWNALPNEKKQYKTLKITIRRQNKRGEVKEEKIIEIGPNLPDDKIKRLGSIINSMTVKKPKGKKIRRRINKSV